MPHYDGKRDKQRRKLVERGEYRELELDFHGYAKTGLAYAAQVPQEFTVETIEGVMAGQAGDYLAIGVNGEMYPIARDVFETSYRRVSGGPIEGAVISRNQARGEVTRVSDIEGGFSPNLTGGLHDNRTVDGQHGAEPVRTPAMIDTPIEA